MQNQSKPEIYIGIDVSKKTLDIAVYSQSKTKQFENNSKGIKSLVNTYCYGSNRNLPFPLF
jgi:transposase